MHTTRPHHSLSVSRLTTCVSVISSVHGASMRLRGDARIGECAFTGTASCRATISLFGWSGQRKTDRHGSRVYDWSSTPLFVGDPTGANQPAP